MVQYTSMKKNCSQLWEDFTLKGNRQKEIIKRQYVSPLLTRDWILLKNMLQVWSDLKLKYKCSSTKSYKHRHSVGASWWILEGIGKKGVGTWGWVKRFRVIVRPVAGTGAVVLQFGAEKRTLIQTERVTLPPIHWVVLVAHKRVLTNTTRPNQGWSCTETVPLCTNAHQRRQQTFPPLLITHKQTTAHFTHT